MMTPVEPMRSKLAVAGTGAGRRARHRRDRRRPRTGHAARRLPPWAVPDAVRPAPHRLVLARPAGRPARSTGSASAARCAAARAASRSARDTAFAEVTMVRCADPRRPGGWINEVRRRLHPAARPRLGPLGRVLRRRTSSSAGCTACASGASSPASRCSTRRPTPPRSRSSPSSTGSGETVRRCSTCSGSPAPRSLGAVECPGRSTSPPGRCGHGCVVSLAARHTAIMTDRRRRRG